MLRSLMICLAILVVHSGIANAQDVQRYRHNGSTVELIWTYDGDETEKLVIKYLKPRKGLPARSGDVLFVGYFHFDFFDGEAYVFSSKCGKLGYRVYGNFTGGGNILLKGDAPVRNSNCKVIRYENNANATLFFEKIK